MTAFDASNQGSLAEGSARHSDADPVTSDTNVVFPTGSVVECRTALTTRITGQVLSYDHPTRLLLIKDTSSGTKPLLRLLNLALVEEVCCVRDSTPEYVPYTSGGASQQQIHDRIRKAEQLKQASLLHSDVSLEGQRIFLYLRKTLDDVKWQGENISILERVLVRPPFTAESVETAGDSTNPAFLQAKEHVRKILAKYYSCNESTRTTTDDAPADPSPSR